MDGQLKSGITFHYSTAHVTANAGGRRAKRRKTVIDADTALSDGPRADQHLSLPLNTQQTPQCFQNINSTEKQVSLRVYIILLLLFQ